MANFKVRLVTERPDPPPDFFAVRDPDTGEVRNYTRDEMIALITALINEGKLEIEI